MLRHLTDVRTEVLTGEDAGSFRLVFTFEQNPYFSNKVTAGGGLCNVGPLRLDTLQLVSEPGVGRLDGGRRGVGPGSVSF